MAELTPTQTLILDVLTARLRLGQRLIAVDARLARSVASLERQGLVWFMHGAVEHTIRVALTDAGRERWMDEGYLTPLERKARKRKKQVKALRRLVGRRQ